MRTKISAGFSKILNLEEGTNMSVYSLSMAKNESESCVISFQFDEKTENACFVATKTHPGIKVELEREYTIEIEGVKYPDPLAPLENGLISSNPAELVNILVRFTSTAETDAGEYGFEFSLNDAHGKSICDFTVLVRVWDFALPAERTVGGTMGVVRGSIEKAHGLRSLPHKERWEKSQKLYCQYYDLLLKNRISAYDLPYDILDPRADEYMSNPSVTCFRVNDRCPEEQLIKYYEKLSSNPVWLKKAFFYPLDEPRVPEHIPIIIERSNRLHELCPGIKIISPFFKNQNYTKEADQIEVLVKQLDILCAKITCWNDEFIYADDMARKEQFGSFASRMAAAKAEGRTIWQYVCWEPGKPYVNMYINEDGLDHRLLFWQQHLVGATGFLYWCANWWELVDDPWTDMVTVPDLCKNVYGDGSVLYNGNKVGFDGACSSVRLEAIRDGLEDCEMLSMASELLGDEWVMETVKSVTADLTHYTDSHELFTSVRNSVGDAIEAALAK